MVQLNILCGKQAGIVKVIHRFPCIIGRAASADVCVEESGVWDRHLELILDSSRNFTLKTLPNTLASVNGQPFHETELRNGDVLEIGSLKMRFWLNEALQKSLRAREFLTWLGLGVLCAGQIGLIYRLLR
jgi:pSer/pThr/pTyr-binding forkhead associated (FHA) protein